MLTRFGNKSTVGGGVTNDITKICTSFHNVTALSLLTLSTSVTLSLTTTIANTLFIVALSRNMNKVKNSMFYKLLFNIGVADLLTGVFTDPISISVHTKEAFSMEIHDWEKRLLHGSIFTINGTSILTMGVLCVDRLLSILRPLKYRHGSRGAKGIFFLCLPWLVSGILIVPYFKVHYVRYLEIFSCVTVVSAFGSIVAVVVVNKLYLKPPVRTPGGANLKSFRSIQITPLPRGNRFDDFLRRHSRGEVLEERVNKSFLVMLFMFLMTYLPSTTMTMYMNFCTHCHCASIYWLRDLTFLCILSSALWRPLYFMLRMQNISREVKNTLRYCWKKAVEMKNGRHETTESSH